MAVNVPSSSEPLAGALSAGKRWYQFFVDLLKLATEKATLADVGAMVTGNTETGIAVTFQSSDNTIDFAVAFASASDQETATSAVTAVSPSVQQRHPSAVKFWWCGTTSGPGTATTTASYNVSAVSSAGLGLLSVSVDTDFSSGDFVPMGMALDSSSRIIYCTSRATTGATYERARPSDGTLFDGGWSIGGVGDQ